MSSQLDKPSTKKKASRALGASSKSFSVDKSTCSDNSKKYTKSGRSCGSKKSGNRKKSKKKKKNYSKTLSRSTSKEVELEEETKKYERLKLIFKGEAVREITVVNFLATSVSMKQRLSNGSLFKTLDLQDYTPECGNVIADYLEKGTVKSSISYFSLGEVLNLSSMFKMDDLNRKMEDVMMVAAAQSSSNLLQTLLVANCSTVSKETMTSLHFLAAWRFLELAWLEDFYKIPPNQFLIIFGSCELNVSHEVVAVDAALQWLAGQRNLEVLAPAVFAMVRSSFLSTVERNMIIERTVALNFPQQVARTIRALLNSRCSMRTCLKPEHVSRRLVRCGMADTKERKEEPSLPLSKPKSERGRLLKERKSSRSKRISERSGKKSKTTERSGRRSRKMEKSKRSQRSSKSGKSSKETSSKSRESSRKSTKNIKSDKKSSRRQGKSSK